MHWLLYFQYQDKFTFETACNVVVMAYSVYYSSQLPVRTEENHEKCKLEVPFREEY